MLLNKKTRTRAITLVLLSCLLLLNFNQNILAEDPFDSLNVTDIINYFSSMIDFNEKLNPHPYRFVGMWKSNITTSIKDDMKFELYFSSPIFAQFELLELIDYQDTLKIDVYHVDSDGVKTLIQNGNTTIKLIPETEEYIQKFTVTLENVQVNITENEYLAFVIEIKQTEKPVKRIVEKRYDTKLVPRMEKLADILRKIDDPSLQEIAMYIDIILENLSKFNLGGEEFGALVNVLASSAFYYGSVDYPSSVAFFDDDADEIRLYFQSEYSDFQYDLYSLTEELLPYEKIANETKPTLSDTFAWPPLFSELSLLLESPENISAESEIVKWIAIWILYTLGEPIEDIVANKVTYYLAENEKLTTDKPGETDTIRLELTKEPSNWATPIFERNKLLTNITAYLYIQYSKILTLGKVKINATLKKNNEIIATDEKDLDRTSILEIIQKGPNFATEFTFDDFDTPAEIWYTDNLTLEVSYVKKPILGLLRPIIINYGSQDYPSKIDFTLKETDNIKVSDMPEKAVYAGGSAHYQLKIISEYNDNVEITVEEKEKTGDWKIDFYPKEFEIEKEKTIDVYINSSATDASAYDNDEIDFYLNVSGNTGFYSNKSHVYVSRNEVEYGLEVFDAPEDIEIKHGSSKTYTIVIKNKNKGFIEDGYSLECTSKNNFSVITDLIDQNTEKIKVDDEAKVNITIQIPKYTSIDSDEITIIITSTESALNPPEYIKTLKINAKVITPNILESIYKSFESAASKIGLTGKYAGWILISVVVLLLIIIFIILIYLKKRGFVEIICLERIKDITPDENAKYEITVKNPYKYDLTYNIESKIENDTQGFDISIDKTELALQSGEEKVINLIVKPNDNVKKEDWCEVKISIRPCNKAKTNEISTITTIKNGKTDIKLSGVFHWPKIFKKDDRVETSFKVWNHGNVSTGKISIIFFVNGKEKNKVEDVVIPRGGYADIEIPWIAESGKNEVYIVVN